MEYIMYGLLGFSLILLVISLFLKDPYKSVREDLDQLSMQQIQELYQIKKKLKILEEELLVGDGDYQPPIRKTEPKVQPKRKEVHAIIKNQVISLAQQGLSVDQIAKQSSLSHEDVEYILDELVIRGNRYE